MNGRDFLPSPEAARRRDVLLERSRKGGSHGALAVDLILLPAGGDRQHEQIRVTLKHRQAAAEVRALMVGAAHGFSRLQASTR
jgi:hypothetical protein